MTEPLDLDAVGQAELVASGQVTPQELVAAAVARVEARDTRLGAVIHRFDDRAVDQASRVVPGTAPFAGVPFLVKDAVCHTAGDPYHLGMRFLKALDWHEPHDTWLAGRFRRAGFVFVGKTNTPELASSATTEPLAYGPTRNPWDTTRSTGGSSGGAAAAVAAGMVAVAHGNDMGGSIRNPASQCGLVGLKPTRGLVSFGPELDDPYYGTSVDGVLTRSVRDAAALLDVFVGRSVVSTSVPDGDLDDVRVALTTTAPFGTVDAECADAAREAARLLEAAGCPVEERTPAWDVILAAATGPMSVPGAAGLVRPEQVHLVEPRNRPLVERLAALTVVEHAQWVEQCRAVSGEFLRFWDDVDVLVSPTSGIVAPSVDWAPWDQSPAEHMATFASFPNFAQPFNLSGQPALSVPTGWSRDGLPIGVHLAARRGDEATLFRVARVLELAAPWSERRPPAPSSVPTTPASSTT